MHKITIALCLFLALSGNILADGPSLSLNEFWKQWYEKGLDLQSHNGQKFIRDHTRHWRPEMIPAMVLDVIAHEPGDGELRDYVYATAILNIPDRRECKEVLAKIRASPQSHQADGRTDTEDEIAYDFQAAIEEVESGELKPAK